MFLKLFWGFPRNILKHYACKIKPKSPFRRKFRDGRPVKGALTFTGLSGIIPYKDVLGCGIMRFIGSKAHLLEKIDQVILEHATGRETIFCDIFSGTGVVARYFKPRYEIHSNDILYFSYVIQKATVENNKKPVFLKLRDGGISDPFRFLEEAEIPPMDKGHLFITEHYSPHEHCKRMYLSHKNALRADFIRNTLDAWKKQCLVTELEYYYLLAGLIEAIPSVSNITGTYGAYLKHWDKRALKDLEMVRLDVVDNKRKNRCYQQDANKLIRELEGDILYLDPPYNTRQYAPNYHLLETISKYDCPEVHGVTGMRPYEDAKSDFCVKSKVSEALEDLVAKAKFRHIVLSYSTDGLMASHEIEQILKRHGIEKSYQRYDIPYRQYKSKKPGQSQCLYEYLFYVEKRLPRKSLLVPKGPVKEPYPIVDPKKYIKSPMNYIGGKYKLLPQLLPLFPKNINTFVDLFSGGCNVAINVTAKKILCNDINWKVVELFEAFRSMELPELLCQIKSRIAEYGLSKENEEGFQRFREFYNKTRDPIDLYTLTCYSFNYQFRFNNSLEYNNPFGRARSQFSENMERNLIAFVTRLKSMNVEFTSKDFTEIPLEKFNSHDFFYCDPPYLITTGTYNDGSRGFKDWKASQEHALYQYLDHANQRGIRFALSNVMEHKGKQNSILLEWAKKYKLVPLDYTYSNSSYNTKRGESKEVLVINY